MEHQTLDKYVTAKYAKMLAVAPAKAGKTCFLAAQSLGVFPGQKYGGIISHPSDLHILAFDAGAVTGLKEFLVQICNLPAEYIPQIHVWNFQKDVREAFMGAKDYSGALLSKVFQVRDEISEKAQNKTAVCLVSSLTGLAIGLERSLMGSPFTSSGEAKKGYGDVGKWNMFRGWIQELQNHFQVDDFHCIWEGHLYKPPPSPQKKRGDFDEEDEGPKETIQVSGKGGVNFPYNVEQFYYLERTSQKIDGGKCEKVIIDTKPTLNMVSMQGRLSSTNLEPKELDLTHVFHKLGLKVEQWTHKKKDEVKKEPSPVTN